MNSNKNIQLPERELYTWGSFVLDGLETLSALDLNKNDYKIFLFLCSRMNVKDNTAYIKQVDIHKTLKIDTGNVSRSLGKLNSEGLIIKKEKGFMVNPYIFYVGKTNRYAINKLKNDFQKLFSDTGQKPLVIS